MIALSTAGLDQPTLRRAALFVVNIGFAVIAAAALGEWRMVLVGAITAMVLSFADNDGALPARLAMLAMVAAGAAAGGLAGHLLGHTSKLFWPLFLASAFAAGWLYRASRGPQLSARVFAVALSIIAGIATVTAPEFGLLGAVVAVCALTRVIDHFLFGPLPRDAAIPPPEGPTTTAQWLRFALAYAAAAGIGLWIGLTLDPNRAIWVSTTTLVVMQADGGANYRRIVGRIAGTVAGVIGALLLTLVLRTPPLLCAGMVVVAAFVPHYVRRRYWLHTALIALLVLLAYDLATAGVGNEKMSALFVERLADVSLGAILALAGTAVAFPHRVDAKADGDDKGPER